MKKLLFVLGLGLVIGSNIVAMEEDREEREVREVIIQEDLLRVGRDDGGNDKVFNQAIVDLEKGDGPINLTLDLPRKYCPGNIDPDTTTASTLNTQDFGKFVLPAIFRQIAGEIRELHLSVRGFDRKCGSTIPKNENIGEDYNEDFFNILDQDQREQMGNKIVNDSGFDNILEENIIPDTVEVLEFSNVFNFSTDSILELIDRLGNLRRLVFHSHERRIEADNILWRAMLNSANPETFFPDNRGRIVFVVNGEELIYEPAEEEG